MLGLRLWSCIKEIKEAHTQLLDYVLFATKENMCVLCWAVVDLLCLSPLLRSATHLLDSK